MLPWWNSSIERWQHSLLQLPCFTPIFAGWYGRYMCWWRTHVGLSTDHDCVLMHLFFLAMYNSLSLCIDYPSIHLTIYLKKISLVVAPIFGQFDPAGDIPIAAHDPPHCCYELGLERRPFRLWGITAVSVTTNEGDDMKLVYLYKMNRLWYIHHKSQTHWRYMRYVLNNNSNIFGDATL